PFAEAVLRKFITAKNVKWRRNSTGKWRINNTATTSYKKATLPIILNCTEKCGIFVNCTAQPGTAGPKEDFPTLHALFCMEE
ncbi:hypothetical protein DBR06_SOUSAS13310032, partial [Sousa chinensis]